MKDSKRMLEPLLNLENFNRQSVDPILTKTNAFEAHISKSQTQGFGFGAGDSFAINNTAGG